MTCRAQKSLAFLELKKSQKKIVGNCPRCGRQNRSLFKHCDMCRAVKRAWTKKRHEQNTTHIDTQTARSAMDAVLHELMNVKLELSTLRQKCERKRKTERQLESIAYKRGMYRGVAKERGSAKPWDSWESEIDFDEKKSIFIGYEGYANDM